MLDDVLHGPGDVRLAARVRASTAEYARCGQLARRVHSTRIERGETVPSIPTVRAWLAACHIGDEPTVRRIVDLAEAVQAETRGWDELLGREGHAQREAAQMEAAVQQLRVFQPTVVPGLLQVPEYARALFSIGRTRDVEAAVAARVTRRRVLYEPGQAFLFLVAEAALHWPLGGPAVHAAQLDRIVSLSRLPAVDIAVLPISAVVATPWHNFQLWTIPDEAVRVTAEFVDGERDTSDPASVDLYEALWQRLWGAAAQGDDALRLIRCG